MALKPAPWLKISNLGRLELDLRTLYLKDLTLIDCRFQKDTIFSNLVRHIERDEIRPIVARTDIVP